MLILTLFAFAGLLLRLLDSAFKMFFLKFCLEALSYLLGDGDGVVYGGDDSASFPANGLLS